jgi:hypothetical protein
VSTYALRSGSLRETPSTWYPDFNHAAYVAISSALEQDARTVKALSEGVVAGHQAREADPLRTHPSNRFRFLTEPLAWALVALLLDRTTSLLRALVIVSNETIH